MKKIKYYLITLILSAMLVRTTNVNIYAFANEINSNVSNDYDKNDDLKFEVFYTQEVDIDTCTEFAGDLAPSYITGTYEYNNEVITFGIKNTDNKSFKDFKNTIISTLENDINSVKNEAKISEDYKINTDTILIKKIDYFGSEIELDEAKQLYAKDSISIKKMITIDEMESATAFKKNIASSEAPSDNEELFAASDTLVTNTFPKGGPSFPDTVGPINPYQVTGIPFNPQKGDRQDRGKLKARFSDNLDMNTYFWWPNFTVASPGLSGSNEDSDLRRAMNIRFKWDEERLSNLIIDNNEAIEIEALFYNYGADSTIPGDGTAWLMELPDFWRTNLPFAYLDTRFMDSENEKSYAIGTAFPSYIVAEKEYNFYFYVNGYKSGTSRLWSVNYQRGYYYDHPNLAYRAIRGNGDEWFVFNEEYESAIKIKQYHKYHTTYYAPDRLNTSISFADIRGANFSTAFKYKESFDTIKSEDITTNWYRKTAQIKTLGNYAVYKFQANTAGTYTFCTAKLVGDQDSVITLYDQSFIVIAQNDDADNTTFSRITSSLAKGDYYLVVKPKITTSSLNCNVYFTKGANTIPK